MAATPKPDLSKIWAVNALPSSVVPPSDTKIGEGWSAEIPPFEWFNWIQKTVTQGLKYFAEKGIFEWDSNFIWPVDGQCMRNGVHYISLVADNQGNDPALTLGTKWKQGFQTLSQLNAKIQWGPYDPTLSYNAGDVVLGSNGKYYECYVKTGTITGVDPTVAGNRFPTVFNKWIEYDGAKTGSMIIWPGNTVPEGYIDLGSSGSDIALDKNDYWRLAAAFPELTDATNVTLPFMLGKTVIGAGTGFNIRSNLGSINHSHNINVASGGSHTHTVTNAAAGAHNHSASNDTAGAHAHAINVASHILTINQIPSHAHVVSNTIGYDGQNQGSPKNSPVYDNAQVTSARSTLAVGGGLGHTHNANSANTGGHTHTINVASNTNHTHNTNVSSHNGHTHNATSATSASYQPSRCLKVLIKA